MSRAKVNAGQDRCSRRSRTSYLLRTHRGQSLCVWLLIQFLWSLLKTCSSCKCLNNLTTFVRFRIISIKTFLAKSTCVLLFVVSLFPYSLSTETKSVPFHTFFHRRWYAIQTYMISSLVHSVPARAVFFDTCSLLVF